MTPERWKQIETLYQAARELEEAEREGFLRQASDGDQALRREVESLLGYEGQAAEFIESPALDLAARELAEQDSGTRIGKRIGSYEVLSLLGRGGMGEVYLAADERLDRKAALKFLPETMQQDPTARQRFLREAKSAAALDHPFICKIYEVGESDGAVFIAMEYVQGETLERKLAQGRLPLKATLEKAVEIAEALEVAHKRHIVHRDLKPSNILITPEGHVKVMDFGLAKRLASAEDETQRQTVTPNLSRTGMTLGTLAYMSPEQVRGEAVDTRSDIFAFGVVLYEMLTGAHPFRKSQALETGHAILNEAPAPVSEYLEHTSALLQHTLRKMLAKEPERRYQHMDDARINLEEVIREIESPVEADGGAVEPAVRATATSAWRRALPWGLALSGVLALGAAALLWSDLRQASPARQPVTRFPLATQPLAVLRHASSPVVALSPDGTHLAYIAGDDDIGQLYVRRLDSMEAKPIAGADNASGPFFSPDGKWIAFFAGGKLKKVSVSGGPPVNLCDATGGNHGGAWGADSIIIFQAHQGLSGVSADGGIPEQTTTANLEGGETFHGWPEVLPGGKAFLFTAGDHSGRDLRVWGQDLSTGQRRLIVAGGNARYLSSGHLVFASAGSLLAAPFDPERLELTGPVVPVIEDILMGLPNERSIGHFAVSASGTLIYLPGPLLSGNDLRTLVWVDRQGQEEPLDLEPGDYLRPRISPDGSRLAADVLQSGNWDIWIYDLARQTLRRLTFHPADDGRPVWTPDGRRVIFRSGRDDPAGWNLFWKAADGSGQAERLTMEPNPGRIPWSFTPDGKKLAFSQVNPETGFDLHLLSMEEGYNSKPLLRVPFSQGSPAISPDGRWIAYRSYETGIAEIQVRPFPNVEDGRWQITTQGGIAPLWAPTGRELFYFAGDSMIVVPIETDPVFTPGKPRVLFTGNYSRNYDISPDGRRFLMIKAVERTLDPSARDELIVVLNWFEELKRLAPAGQ